MASSISSSDVHQDVDHHGLPSGLRLTAADRPGVAQPVPERDIPDQPWQRRFGFGAPKLAAVLAADNTQPLVECEPGHFVAVEDDL